MSKRSLTTAIMIALLSLGTVSHAEDDDLSRNYAPIVPIHGGTSFNDASDVKPGRYRLDRPLKANEYYYFKIKIAPGERLVCRVRTIGDQDEGGITIYSSQRQLISRAVTFGADIQKSCLYDFYDMSGSGADMYLAIGSEMPSTVQAIYDIVIYDHTGWFSSKDASDQFNAALEITPGVTDFLSYAPNDMQDMYVMKLKAGEKAVVTLKPGQAEGRFRVTVYDGKTGMIAQARNNAPGDAVKLAVTNNGDAERIYIKVDRDNEGDPSGEYTIGVEVIRPQDAPAPQ